MSLEERLLAERYGTMPLRELVRELISTSEAQELIAISCVGAQYGCYSRLEVAAGEIFAKLWEASR